MRKKTKAAVTAECLRLSEEWGERAVDVKTLIDDKTIVEQQQTKAITATARTYKKCASELISIFKEDGLDKC